MKKDSLNPSRLRSLITQSPEFQAALPHRDPESMTLDERRNSARRAVALGGAALSLRLEQERGAYDLDAQLTALISQLDDFYFSLGRVNKFRAYKAQHPDYYASEEDWQRHEHDREKVSRFNHTVGEVINASRGQFNFDELVTFMTQQHIILGGHDTQEDFHTEARSLVVGIRNEMAVEQVLIASGVEFERGTEDQDLHGGDFIVEGVPIDFKASLHTAERAKKSASERGYNPDTIVWSHIKFSDFRGGLVLPAEHNERVAKELIPDIERAVTSEKQRQAARQNRRGSRGQQKRRRA